MALADKYLAHGAAADSSLDEIRDIRDVDAVSRRRLAICRDGDLAQRRPVVDQHLVGARHGLEYVGNVLADAAQFIKFLAEDLYRELAMRLENLVLDTIQDGLAEGEFVAWKLRKPCP